MLTIEIAGNTTRMNVASHVNNISPRKQLLLNHLILNLPVMKSKMLKNKKYWTKAS